MKTLIFASLVFFAISPAFCQALTDKGNTFLEIGTSPFGSSDYTRQSTSLYFDADGFSAGIEGGYFIMNNWALKAGFGTISNSELRGYNYKVGTKYYLFKRVPIQLEYNVSTTNYKFDPLIREREPLSRDHFTLGIGYNIPLSSKIYLEPYVGVMGEVNDSSIELLDYELKLNFVFTF